MNRYFFSLFLLFSSLIFQTQKSFGQVLLAPTLNLNANAAIFDVIDDPWQNCFIVVGSFDSINGVARKRLAFIDKTTLAVKTNAWANPIQNINGNIYTVQLYRIFTISPSQFTYHLYIGGNFTSVTVNGSTSSRNCLAKLTSTHPTINPSPNNYITSTWNAGLNIGPGADSGIKDMDISNDTLFFTGNFDYVNNGIGPNTERQSGIAAVSIVDNTHLLMFNTGFNMLYNIKKIDWSAGKMYVAGDLPVESWQYAFHRILASGEMDPSFTPQGIGIYGECGCHTGSGRDFVLLHDTIAFYEWTPGGSVNSTTGNYDLSNTPDIVYTSNIEESKHTSIATYKDYLYITRDTSLDNILDLFKAGLFSGKVGSAPVGMTGFSQSMTCNFSNLNREHVWVVDNLLIVSDSTLSSIGHWMGAPHYSRKGAAVYCLEPHDAKPFTAFDTTVCPDQIINFAIPTVNYANGYIWEYTGNGIDIGVIGTENLSDTLFSTNANSINIKIKSNFTPGELKVTPFSNFNNQLVQAGVLIPSNTISINLHSNPLPNIHAGNDTVITCYNELIGIELHGYSDSTIISEVWSDISGFPTYAGAFFTASDTGKYIYKVTSPLGCPNFDTVHVGLNTTKPIALPPSAPYEINCANPVQLFSGSTPTSNSISLWYINSGDSIQNPISVDAPGIYYYRVRDTLNGCFKDTGIYVSLDNDPPNIAIEDYPVAFSPIDTLTCFQDTLNLICYSDSSNSVASWINTDTSVFFGDNLEIYTGGYYHLFATDNDNGCTNSLTIFIAENFSVPGVGTAPYAELNCSTDSLVLTGASLTVGATTEWSGLSISNSVNPVTVFNPGTYYITATHPINGCTSTDSVLVSLTQSILVSAGNDTLVCDLDNVPVQVNYVGTIGGINFLWSNGSTSQTATYTAGSQPYAIAEVFGDDGCYGTDTVFFNLPPTVSVLFEGFKPCDNNPSGQIVATPIVGLEPLQYSIDGGSIFQSSPVFTGLYMGTYPVLVRDSINCEYNFTAIIDGNSNLPTPTFLFSTYNFATDTVVIIDVSNPPTDSTVWIFPSQLIVLDSNPISPMILMPDTGTFVITMQAFYGSCLVELSKTIYASPFDSLTATQYNLNGIKSIELYPNPTSGNFAVEVEFYKSQRAAMVVQDMIGNTYVFNEYDESLTVTENIFLDLTVIDGTYVLKVVSEFDSATVTFVLAR